MLCGMSKCVLDEDSADGPDATLFRSSNDAVELATWSVGTDGLREHQYQNHQGCPFIFTALELPFSPN